MKKFFYGRLVLPFVFLVPAFGAMAQSASIKGKVGNGSEVLPGATVIFGSKATVTDAKGEFSFKVKTGTHTVAVSYTGYKKMEQQVTISEDSSNEFDFVLQPLSLLENIIIVGSRAQSQRSNLYTAVPIDLLRLSELPERQVEITKVIANNIPSFNAAPHGFVTGRHMIPASLRGLGPDQTLVLLNGRRQHTMASPWTFGVTGFGTVGTDLNAIPSDAVEKIEVLRDGASAQYGSDAIAGVIHLRLKESTGVTTIRLNTGQYYEGDGEGLSFGINHGFVFLKKGFLNTTIQFRYNNYTQRNGSYDSLVYYNFPTDPTASQKDSILLLDNKRILERGFDRVNHRPLGDNRVYNMALALNGGYPVSNATSLYWTGIFNYRFVNDISSNLYRFPRDSARGQIIMQLHPDGFLPYLESKIPDFSFIAGAKGTTRSGWHWDAGSVFGMNSTKTDVTNTNNASLYSMGNSAPTRFYTGKQVFSQLTNNITFNRRLSNKPGEIKSVHFGGGAEWRIEQYRIKEGEEASWKNYAPSGRKAGGSQGSAGFSPENVINKSRHVLGSYAELEVERNQKLLVNLAARFEYYTDYNANLAGKIAFNYRFSKRFTWRGSVSNGFRAPSLQQRYYSLITTMSRQSTTLFKNGTFRNESEVANAFGVAKLEPEKAINISTGFTSALPKNMSITVDAYWIQIQHRILYGGILSGIQQPEVRHLLDSLHLPDIETVRFFANAINTHTMGLDIVFNGRWSIGKSLLETSLAINVNKTDIYRSEQYAKNLPDNVKFRNLLVNRDENCRIEDAYPKDKIILNIDYRVRKWTIHPSFTRYGEVTQRQNNLDSLDQTFSPKIVSSLNIRFDVTRWLAVIAGGENIFDVYPDKLKDYGNTANGLLKYSPNFAAFGCNGGYYFVAMNVHL